MKNKANIEWQDVLFEVLNNYDYVVSPRGMEVREKISGHYTVPMPAYLDLLDRKVNYSFMFAEAHWIISGSNRLEDLVSYMPKYKEFSDDDTFLKGAYGPKVIDQFPYIIESLMNDRDSRQAVMTIWRERPSDSKDIPCTVAFQFLIRNGKLEMVATMRSNDIVLGLTYDIFTFSMVAKSVQLLLKAKGIYVDLGNLHVNAGSLHIYKTHYVEAETWIQSAERETKIIPYMKAVLNSETYSDLIYNLKSQAHDYKFYAEKLKEIKG